MKICIDAGHNHTGYDTGAKGNGFKEQDITFEVAEKLKNVLEKRNAQIVMTREKKTTNLGNSVTGSLSERCRIANNSYCDLFVSLHCNSFPFSSVNGVEVITYSEKSALYNSAKEISKRIAEKMNTSNRGVKTSKSLYVLKNTKMPSMIIELGFISNTADVYYMHQKQDELAKIIADVIYPVQETDTPKPYKYHIEGITHIVEIDPRNIWCVETQEKTNKTPYNNFVNSVFFMNLRNGKTHPQGIMVNAGEVLCNNATHNKPVATLVVYGKDNVKLEYVSDITKLKNVWFAVSGFGIYPEITANKEGFTDKFSDVLRSTDRPIIGYRKKDNKIVIAVRKNSSAARANETAKNLGLDFAISLDGGGSATLKVGGKYKFKGNGRKIYGGIIWQ